MSEYRFLTTWKIEAPLRHVYDAIYHSSRWPDWWRGAERVEQLYAGDEKGIGSILRYTWKSRLRYGLIFEAHATHIEPLTVLEASINGDLEGYGRWSFSGEGDVTTVRYEWHVRTTKHWMNFLAPVARTVFVRNHHALMQSGAEGLARLLDARLLGISHTIPSNTDDHMNQVARHPINWMAGAISGIAAGIIATLIQVALWWMFHAPLPEIFFRDSRLAAAIVMGPTVLPPPSTFDWSVMLIAGAVHFALSIAYGLLLAPLVARLARLRASLAGTIFGLILYGTNMYGFTAVFPWFVASRDWITATAHIAFGATAAWLYKMWDDYSNRTNRL